MNLFSVCLFVGLATLSSAYAGDLDSKADTELGGSTPNEGILCKLIKQEKTDPESPLQSLMTEKLFKFLVEKKCSDAPTTETITETNVETTVDANVETTVEEPPATTESPQPCANSMLLSHSFGDNCASICFIGCVEDEQLALNNDADLCAAAVEQIILIPLAPLEEVTKDTSLAIGCGYRVYPDKIVPLLNNANPDPNPGCNATATATPDKHYANLCCCALP